MTDEVAGSCPVRRPSSPVWPTRTARAYRPDRCGVRCRPRAGLVRRPRPAPRSSRRQLRRASARPPRQCSPSSIAVLARRRRTRRACSPLGRARARSRSRGSRRPRGRHAPAACATSGRWPRRTRAARAGTGAACPRTPRRDSPSRGHWPRGGRRVTCPRSRCPRTSPARRTGTRPSSNWRGRGAGPQVPGSGPISPRLGPGGADDHPDI